MTEILRGDARAVSLGTLLQVVESENLSGAIRFTPSGEIGVSQGAPVRARYAGVTGVDALLEIFLQPPHSFVLDAGAPEAGESLGVTVGIVLDACRLQDDWRRVASLVLVPSRPGPLPGVLAPLSRLLDGRRSVWQAVEAAAIPRSKVTDPLGAALADGLLRTAEAPIASVEPPALSEDASDEFGVLIEVARRLTREGSFDLARGAFERALAIRPGDRVALQNLKRLSALRERT